MPGKIFIIESHPVHRESYAFLVDRQDDLRVCGVVGSMDDAELALEDVSPDLVVVNLATYAMDEGLRRIGAFHAAHPDLPLLVVTASESASRAEKVRSAGAEACLPRFRVPFELVTRIRRMLGTPLSDPSPPLSPAA